MKRVLIAAVLAGSLGSGDLLAAETNAGPLAPGKPAGVAKAQDAATIGFWVLAVGGISGLVALGLSQGSKPIATTTTTTST